MYLLHDLHVPHDGVPLQLLGVDAELRRLEPRMQGREAGEGEGLPLRPLPAAWDHGRGHVVGAVLEAVLGLLDGAHGVLDQGGGLAGGHTFCLYSGEGGGKGGGKLVRGGTGAVGYRAPMGVVNRSGHMGFGRGKGR